MSVTPMIVIGIVLLVRTLQPKAAARSAAGVLLGILFVLAGAARLYLLYRGR